MPPFDVAQSPLTKSFDHSDVAGLPEYAAVSAALDDLVHAIKRQDELRDQDDPGAVTQARWMTVVTEMASALPYADNCSACEDDPTCVQWPAPAPFAGVVTDDWLKGTYLCPACGATWTCGYAVWAPLMFG